jgi:type VI secretion system secreted protein Hcp
MACDNFLYFPASAKGGLLSDKAMQPKGETTDEWFKKLNALECKSVTFGLTQSQTSGSATGGASAGKAKFDEFTIRKDVDAASVPLFNACVAGAHFPTVMLVNRKPGGNNVLYLQYCFRQVFVTNITWDGGGGEENPTETIKFKFGAMGIQYVPQNSDGTANTASKMEGAWNTVTNDSSLNIDGLGRALPYLPPEQS